MNRILASFRRGGLGDVGAALLSGFLLSLAFSPAEQPFLAWIALMPVAGRVLWAPLPAGRLWAMGAVFGLSHFLSVLWWVTTVTSAGWLALSMIVAVYPAAWVVFWERVAQPVPPAVGAAWNLRTAALGACGWTGLEWLRGTLFTGFPWNYVGVSQAPMLSVIQIAELGGVLAVSWVVVFVSLVFLLGLFRLVREARKSQPVRPHWDLFLALALVGACFAFSVGRLTGERRVAKELRYLAVQPAIEQVPWGEGAGAEEYLRTLELLSLAGLAGGEAPQAIFWPEVSVPYQIYPSYDFQAVAAELRARSGADIVLGTLWHEPQRVYNAAVVAGANPDEEQVYFKNHLVIMGEYVPLADWLPFLRFFVPLGEDFSAGSGPALFTLPASGVTAAPLICFEDTVAPLARRAAAPDPDLLLNLTNDGWFGRSAQARQHVANALFRAIELRKPLLRVSNDGLTCLISPWGTVENQFRDPVTGDTRSAGIMKGTVKIYDMKPTFYQKHGDWLPHACLALILAWLAWPWGERMLWKFRKRA
jgi:apolipoprotein N-acyltransferase